MSILWFGGEDIDFPVQPGGGVTLSTTTSIYRAGFSRLMLYITAATDIGRIVQSKTFAGGAVTSCWFSFRYNPSSLGISAARIFAGLTLGGTSKGLFIGNDTSTATKLALVTLSGTTRTQLAAEAGTSLAVGPSTSYKIDVQLVNYGATATVNVFLNGALVITFSGDVTVSGVSNLDSVAIGATGGGTNPSYVSEFAVADEDTRNMLGVQTMSPTSTGTTNQFTNNTVTNVNPTAYADTNATYTNTGAQDQQYNITDEPALGTYDVKAVRVAARAWMTSGATANKIKLGFNSGGSVAVGSAKSLSTAADTYEQIWATNPVTGSAWGDATEMNALQIDLQSST